MLYYMVLRTKFWIDFNVFRITWRESWTTLAFDSCSSQARIRTAYFATYTGSDKEPNQFQRLQCYATWATCSDSRSTSRRFWQRTTRLVRSARPQRPARQSTVADYHGFTSILARCANRVKHLPDSVHAAPSIIVFKSQLKTHFYRLNFQHVEAGIAFLLKAH